MIIDSHTHVLPDQFRLEKEHFLEADLTFKALFGSPKAASASAIDLLNEMQRSGVAKSVVAGYGWTDISTATLSNDYLLDSAKTSVGHLIPLCSANPIWGSAAIEEIERCAELGAQGIGELHPDSQNFLNSDFGSLQPFFKAAERLNLPILMHTSEPVGHNYPGKGTVTPAYSLALADAFPENIFVFAHFGGGLPFYALMPEVRERLRNVYFDSAAFPFLYRPEVFKASVSSAGKDKILFGSDFPLISQTRSLKELDQAGLVDNEGQAVLGANAADIWLAKS